MSVAVTEGIRVAVESTFLADKSDPIGERYVFGYTITISNEGDHVAQLRNRHWIISDANEHVEEVKGPGVVGNQPVLKPNTAFRYSSGCVLKTPWGTMEGSYQMFREDGSSFDAEVAPFLLAAPFATPAS